MWAQELAVTRLGMDPLRFWAHAPADLAMMFEADRHRRNAAAAVDAWRIAWMVAPHVGRHGNARPSRILLTAPFYDPDPEPRGHGAQAEED